MIFQLKKLLKKNSFLVIVFDKSRELFYKFFVSDSIMIKNQFKKRTGRDVELTNPIKYNDKLQWLKLNWYDSFASKCADKYEVREIVKEKIGPEYLNDLIAVYDSVDQINIDNLPDQFVLKGTHGSGMNVICVDKTKIDWGKKITEMNRWLKVNYFWGNRENVYKTIKPRIICEKYLVQNDGDELRDYRFFCFNGEPKFITVDLSITDKKKTRRNLYDLNWNLMDAEISYPKETGFSVEKPEKLEEMIELSKKLSSEFPHTRIDFYYINNKIIFGEITFFHQNGMGIISPEEFEITMGDWLKLPIVNIENTK